MMKISDPIMFGHAVSVFFADVFEKHAAALKRLGVNLNNGFGDLLTKIETLPEAEKTAIKDDIAADYANGRASPWSIPTRASPTCTSPAT